MTMKDADRLAYEHKPVMYQGKKYERILELGYRYVKDGDRIPFVCLKDLNAFSSLIYTSPDDVEEATDETQPT